MIKSEILNNGEVIYIGDIVDINFTSKNTKINCRFILYQNRDLLMVKEIVNQYKIPSVEVIGNIFGCHRWNGIDKLCPVLKCDQNITCCSECHEKNICTCSCDIQKENWNKRKNKRNIPKTP